MQNLALALRLLFAAGRSGRAQQLTLAQIGAGTLAGTVTTITGQPVPIATVPVLTSILGATADQGGNFSIKNVPAGRQTVAVSAGPTAALTAQLPASTAGVSVRHLERAFRVRNAFGHRYPPYGSLSAQVLSYLQRLPRLLGTILTAKF